jgi:hypothetical protein
MDLGELLRPLQPEHLGVLAVGHLVADGPGRAAAVRDLLAKNFSVDVSEDTISRVITRVLSVRPQLLAGYVTNESVLQPRSNAYAALLYRQYVPAHWQSACVVDQGMLVRVATVPTVCFTLAFGMCQGEVILLQCTDCGAMYAGPWCWPTGGASKKFPEGHHHPKGATSLRLLDQCRWFFATPQVCWETSFLKLCLLLAARGGISWTALFTVYSSLFSSTLAGTQYAHRTHFVSAVEMAVPQLGLQLFARSNCVQTYVSFSFVS